jgi:bifunctional DNA-binding transcriptional regulator/antitoxin component of YhaV-PrlF toxin-antitoxin module
MRALEFQSTVNPNGQITIPSELARQIPQGEQLRVVVRWEPSDLDAEWRAAGQQRFEAAYAPEDSIYEELIDGPIDRQGDPYPHTFP